MDIESCVNYYRENKREYNIRANQSDICIKEIHKDPNDKCFLGVSGGPGVSGDFLAPLCGLTDYNSSILFYDYHNVGNSSSTSNPYSIDSFKKELEGIISYINSKILSNEKLFLIGHSWGSMLILDYVTSDFEKNFDGFIASAPLFNSSKSIEIAKTIRAETLNNEDLIKVIDMEDKDNYNSDKYLKICRSVTNKRMSSDLHDFAEEKLDKMNEDMYNKMWGPSEYHISKNSTLHGWSVEDKLSDIDIENLLITGENDYFGIHDLYSSSYAIGKNSTVEIIKEASHDSLWEKPESFNSKVFNWCEKFC